MARGRQVVFIQGGGERVHDSWDQRLFESLSRELGDDYEVRYPRMPQEDDPSYARWGAAIRRELTALDEGAVVVGHSVGATILIGVVAESPPEHSLVRSHSSPLRSSVPRAGIAMSGSCPMTLGNGCPLVCQCMCSMDWRTVRSRRRTLTCTPGRSRKRWCTSCPDETTSSTTT